MTFMYDGKEYDYADIVDITWEGSRTPRTFRSVHSWIVEFEDGTKLDIDPKKLEDGDKVIFMDVAFPG